MSRSARGTFFAGESKENGYGERNVERELDETTGTHHKRSNDVTQSEGFYYLNLVLLRQPIDK